MYFLDPLYSQIVSRKSNYSRSNDQISSFKKVCFNSTGRFIMFFVITNIYNKKTKGPTLMEFFHSHKKTEKSFLFDN